MELPQPPQDTELRNIIDKLAQFVARNGPEFEQMTKNKQKGNSKFSFLFGGEYFNYYQYKVTTEQAIYKQQQNNESWTSPVSNAELEAINQQQEVLREQIKVSEQNLNAQHTVLLQQQQAQVEIVLSKAENECLQLEADNCEIFLEDIYGILQPIIDNCTKDSISSGKNWILQHATTKDRAFCILHCLLIKVIQGTSFPHKLHVIYLVNDLLHHCARKSSQDLREALEWAVVPMFCNANIGATDEQKAKLDKLLRLWETKLNFLHNDVVRKMRDPIASYQHFQAEKMAKYAEEIQAVAHQTKVAFENYQSQHQAYVCHALQQIMELQQQRQALETSLQQQQKPPEVHAPIITQNNNGMEYPTDISRDYHTNNTGEQFPNDNFVSPPFPPLSGGLDVPFSLPPPTFMPPPLGGIFPDFSKPPPGFAPKPEPPVVEELMPTNPYYDLPAGLMVPLIKLEDSSYKPLDPKDIRLPPPAPPSDRLLTALDAFYSAPTHERPRDSEGWEKLGLYEYYKAKNAARKEKDEQIKRGEREKSRSPSPVVISTKKDSEPAKRRYRSESPPPQQPPPQTQTPRAESPPRRRRSRSRSRSPRRRRERRDSRRGRRRSRSRSQSRSPVRRSPTPPHVHIFSGGSFTREQQEIDSGNKGHQMLLKMGWGGSGLGAHEQGIDAPIAGGEVRDRQDQFKGVGCNMNDPYENFRKNKGAAFITRMKARAEERANENKLIDY